MLKSVVCPFIFSSMIACTNFASASADTVSNVEKFFSQLEPRVAVSVVASAACTYLIWNTLTDELKRENLHAFLQSDFGEKCTVCAACLIALAYLSLHWNQHMVTLAGAGMGAIVHAITVDLFPPKVSLFATVVSCFLASATAAQTFSVMKHSKKKKHNREMVINLTTD
ncbi:MAG: hypothetical protein LBF84_03880 [Holosporales bacterium]|nr:hypothetical protein [Holosporales bacterium]